MSISSKPTATPTDRPDPIADDRLQPYRQPIVTGTGIILGFVLNFAGSFVKGDSAAPEWAAYVVFSLLVVGVGALLTTLSRILVLGVPAERSAEWYRRTHVWFMVGVTSAVGGALVDMLANFMSE